jgi:hypothetical protein
MQFDPYSAALEVIPLAGEGLQKFLDHNEVRKLYKLIKADVRQADLPAGVGAALAEKIEQLRVDPMVAGALKLLLETGESRAKAPLRQRLAQLLVLPDSPMSADELAAVVLRSVEANLHRAKRDDRSAGHLDEQITRDALRDLPHQVAEAVSDGLGPSRGVPMRFVRMLVELAPDQARVSGAARRSGPGRSRERATGTRGRWHSTTALRGRCAPAMAIGGLGRALGCCGAPA